MIQLTTDLSGPLLEILLNDPNIVDGVEVGPWYQPLQVSWYRQRLPGMPFYFHGADLVHTVGVLPGTMGRIQAHLNASRSPWVSLHLSAWLPRWLRGFLRRGWPTPKPKAVWDARRLAWQTKRVMAAVNVPVLLENNDPLVWPGYDYYAEPAWIRQILDETGCGLLLDTGHARVAAAQFGVDTMAYLNDLPLERTVQVHVSGPREKDGRLFDAHQTLQEEDYRLLEHVLSKCQPRVVTLEFIKNADELREQITRLREMLR